MVKDAFCVVVVRYFGRDKLIVVFLMSEFFLNCPKITSSCLNKNLYRMVNILESI